MEEHWYLPQAYIVAVRLDPGDPTGSYKWVCTRVHTRNYTRYPPSLLHAIHSDKVLESDMIEYNAARNPQCLHRIFDNDPSTDRDVVLRRRDGRYEARAYRGQYPPPRTARWAPPTQTMTRSLGPW